MLPLPCPLKFLLRLILIFKKLKREERLPRSFLYFSFLFFNIIEDFFCSEKKEEKGFIPVSCIFLVDL